MSLVSTPTGAHGCGIGWEIAARLPDDPMITQGFGTHYFREIHQHDAPGTVRACPECGKTWVAERYPEVRSGMQGVGIFWRPERRREQKRRERAQRIPEQDLRPVRR
jgi:hypothetical protein